MVERGITHVVIDTTSYNSSDIFEFNVIQEQIIDTAFWKHYRGIQFLTGALSFSFQSASGFDIDSPLTYFRIGSVVLFAVLEKVDFVKDLQVALTFPHATYVHAFLYWFSINLPFFSILIYFWSKKQIDKFLPAFIGYAEILNVGPKNEGEKVGDIIGLVEK